MQQTRQSVSVSDLKARLSEHLQRVKAGESFLITERGRLIGMMTPLPAESFNHDLADLARAGLVRLAASPPDLEFLRGDQPDDPNAAVREALLDERREGR